MLSSVVIAVVLVALSAFLLQSHVQKWSSLKSRDLDPLRLDFGRRQFRRRMLVSLLIGVTGIACLLSPWMVDPTRGQFWWYWGGMLLLVGLLVVFALLDFWDTVRYLRLVQSVLLAKRDEALVVHRVEDRGG